MERIYFDDKTFDKIDFTSTQLIVADYENCIFNECNFSGINLSNINFSGCHFRECNLSLANLSKTAFREVKFTTCKLLGLHFDLCNQFLFEVRFEHCTLNLSSFYKLKMKKTLFNHCTLHETDFADSDLTSAVFDNCDLMGALFENTILEKADFRTSHNFAIDPEKNQMRKARFSLASLPGLLYRYNLEIE